MKIVFSDSIVDVLIRRLHEGKRENKKVEYILLTHEELCDLQHDLRYFQYCDDGIRFYASNPTDAMRGATFPTIELKEPHCGQYSRNPYVRFASHLKFMGVPVYVVPARFM